MARTRGGASRDAGSLYARTRATVFAAARRLGDRDDARCAAAVSALLCAFELVFCVAIIAKVPYTEIDWRAYMDEVGGFLQGERDYTKLKGDTGPLVYPAGFVYLYAVLKKVIIGCADDAPCDDANDVRVAQYVFLVVYVAHLCVTLATYRNARGVVPPYALITLSISKRIHSIFVLRMFNDGVASLFAHLTVFAAQRRKWPLAFFLLSLGVSVKMNVLLMVPPALVLLVGGTRPSVAISSVLIFVVTQIALSLPFWMSGFFREYVSRAFEFSRAFEYKWTVNWRFVSNETFGTKSFARALLVAHVVGLLLFAHKKWYVSPREEKAKALRTRKDSSSVREKTLRKERFFFGFFADWFRRLPRDASPSTTMELCLADPAHVMSTLHEGVFIGVVFARSLHYQFYAWYFHSLPFLLWRCDFFEACAARAFRSETAVRLASDTARVSLLLLIERSWNIFPATEESSRTLFAAHAVLLVGLFFSRRRVKSVRAAEKNDKNA
jgi:alpha-1,3-mannosyltransferase